MSKPNYPFWDLQPEYKLEDAAALCIDLEPRAWKRDDPDLSRWQAMAARLKRDVSFRDLSWTDMVPNRVLQEYVPRHVPGDKLFRREDLRDWSERTGQRALMPFLFPEDRKGQEQKGPSTGVSDREEPTVLKVLAALLQRFYGDNILDDLTSPKSKRFREVYDDVASKMDISEDTLRKYLKRISA